MSNYITINNDEADALVIVFENRCQSSGPVGKNIKMMTLRGDKCDIVYEDDSFDHFLSPFFSLYFKEILRANGTSIKTSEIVARSGYNNILVRYAVKVSNEVHPIMLNGRISKLSDKQDLDKRVTEEVERVIENPSSISEDRLDISHRTNSN